MGRSVSLGPRAPIRALPIIATTTGWALPKPGCVLSSPRPPLVAFLRLGSARSLYSPSREGLEFWAPSPGWRQGCFSLPSYRWGGESVRTGAFGPSSHCDGFSSPVASQPPAGPGGVTIPAGAPWSPVPPMFLHLLSLAAVLLSGRPWPRNCYCLRYAILAFSSCHPVHWFYSSFALRWHRPIVLPRRSAVY